MIVGLISDTHGLLRTEVVQALAGVSMIIHAGDIGSLQVLEELQEIAPVVAVRGNTDFGEWAADLPFTDVAECCAARLYVLHDLDRLDLDPGAAGLAAVVSGHTHRAASFTRNGVVYLNPGSAGPKRNTLPVTLMRVRIGEGAWIPELVDLEPAPGLHG